VENSTLPLREYRELPHLSVSYAQLRGMYQGVTNSFATNQHTSLKLGALKDWIATSSLLKIEGIPFNFQFFNTSHLGEMCWSVRLACLIHAASVHPGPGSNPPIKSKCEERSSCMTADAFLPSCTYCFSHLFSNRDNQENTQIFLIYFKSQI